MSNLPDDVDALGKAGFALAFLGLGAGVGLAHLMSKPVEDGVIGVVALPVLGLMIYLLSSASTKRRQAAASRARQLPAVTPGQVEKVTVCRCPTCGNRHSFFRGDAAEWACGCGGTINALHHEITGRR